VTGTGDDVDAPVPNLLADDTELRDSLANLAQLSLGQLELAAMLEHVAEFAVHAIPGADGAGLTLFHDNRPSTIVASAPFVEEIDAIQYGIGEGPCITAAAEARTVRSGSLGTDPVWPRFGPKASELGVHSVLSLPLQVPHGVVGAMNVYAHANDAFKERAVKLGELYARPAAVSVQNARALAQARTLAEQLTSALATRPVIDQAIGIIMSRTGSTSDVAFGKLREVSQRDNRKVSVVAERLVEEAVRRARARGRGKHRI
jgi:GAF domain-containing protein